MKYPIPFPAGRRRVHLLKDLGKAWREKDEKNDLDFLIPKTYLFTPRQKKYK
jgi:hypothetical protein